MSDSEPSTLPIATCCAASLTYNAGVYHYVACTGRESRVVDHGKSPVFNVWVHMKDTIIICVRGKKNVHTE